MNWILPNKFLAFSGPSASQRDPDGVFFSAYKTKIITKNVFLLFPVDENLYSRRLRANFQEFRHWVGRETEQEGLRGEQIHKTRDKALGPLFPGRVNPLR